MQKLENAKLLQSCIRTKYCDCINTRQHNIVKWSVSYSLLVLQRIHKLEQIVIE